jgi:hypothetical protein
MEGNWISASTLGTFSGVVFVVTIVVQFVKEPLDLIYKMPTRVLVLLVSWTVLYGRFFLVDYSFTPERLFLNFLNGFVVSLAAIGAYSVASDHMKLR